MAAVVVVVHSLSQVVVVLLVRVEAFEMDLAVATAAEAGVFVFSA